MLQLEAPMANLTKQVSIEPLIGQSLQLLSNIYEEYKKETQ